MPITDRGRPKDGPSKDQEKADLHQQTSLSAGTVSNDDKFAANLSHLAKSAKKR